MKAYFVYILLCNDGSLYTGVTNNLEERLLQHQRGDDLHCFTYKKRPVNLVFHQEFRDINDAISAEKQIKNWTRKKKLALIEGNYDQLREFSQC